MQSCTCALRLCCVFRLWEGSASRAANRQGIYGAALLSLLQQLAQHRATGDAATGAAEAVSDFSRRRLRSPAEASVLPTPVMHGLLATLATFLRCASSLLPNVHSRRAFVFTSGYAAGAGTSGLGPSNKHLRGCRSSSE